MSNADPAAKAPVQYEPRPAQEALRALVALLQSPDAQVRLEAARTIIDAHNQGLR